MVKGFMSSLEQGGRPGFLGSGKGRDVGVQTHKDTLCHKMAGRKALAVSAQAKAKILISSGSRDCGGAVTHHSDS